MKYFGMLLVFLACVFGIFWLNLTPTISPDDVELTGELFKAQELPNPVFADEYNYALAITLDNRTDSNLHKGYYGQYFSNIYVYVDGFVIREYATDSRELDKKGFNTRTAHGYTEQLAKEKLMEQGIHLQNVSLANLHGLYYFGNTFPAKIRYYVRDVKYNPDATYVKTNQKPNLDNSYLIYSHYEKRLGKNLSWVKLSKIDER